MKILTNRIEVDNNPLEESHEAIYEECVKVENIGPENILCNITFFIVSYEYNNNVSL